MRVGYGKSQDPVSAVLQAASSMGALAGPPVLVVAFVGGKLDPEGVHAALKSTFGPVPVVGGSSAGIVSRHGTGYTGFEIGLIVFDDPSVAPTVLCSPSFEAGEYEAGFDLGTQVRGAVGDDAVALMFFDSLKSSPPPVLHFASSIVSGFNAGIGNAPITLIGGGLLTDANLSGGWVYDGTGVKKHVSIALVFPPNVTAETVITHGCRPASAFMQITRVEGATVYEIDGRPAVKVLEETLGISIGGGKGQELSLIATLGQKQGELFTPFDEKSYVNRLILGADRESGSVTLFEPDFKNGDVVQIMSRDNVMMLDSVRDGVAALNASSAGKDNLLALYIDCAGRASAVCGSPSEEAELAAHGMDSTIPMLGFYSGVEVAPFDGLRSKPLDWTGVLTVLRRCG